MIRAALNGDLDNVSYHPHPVFGFQVPVECPGVPDTVLAQTWHDESAYRKQAIQLANQFIENFKKYEAEVDPETRAAAPKNF